MGTPDPKNPPVKLGTPCMLTARPFTHAHAMRAGLGARILLSRGRFTFDQIYNYISDGIYPEGFEKGDKLALRRRASLFYGTERNTYFTKRNFHCACAHTYEGNLYFEHYITTHSSLMNVDRILSALSSSEPDLSLVINHFYVTPE